MPHFAAVIMFVAGNLFVPDMLLADLPNRSFFFPGGMQAFLHLALRSFSRLCCFSWEMQLESPLENSGPPFFVPEKIRMIYAYT